VKAFTLDAIIAESMPMTAAMMRTRRPIDVRTTVSESSKEIILGIESSDCRVLLLLIAVRNLLAVSYLRLQKLLLLSLLI